jgi:hypothetical protein
MSSPPSQELLAKVFEQNAVENVYLKVLSLKTAASQFGVSVAKIAENLAKLPPGLAFDNDSCSLRRYTCKLLNIPNPKHCWRPKEMRDALRCIIVEKQTIMSVANSTLIRE